MVVLGDGIHNLTDGLAIGEGRGEVEMEGQGCTGTRGCRGTGVHRDGVHGALGHRDKGHTGIRRARGWGAQCIGAQGLCRSGTKDPLPAGAAFSHSLSSGLSTALAVLCHELPHELGRCLPPTPAIAAPTATPATHPPLAAGDLAVLLRAGTAPRTILLLNLLSALLSCLGAAAGAAVGQNASHLTPWILTATAGIFLYVALADMVRGWRW